MSPAFVTISVPALRTHSTARTHRSIRSMPKMSTMQALHQHSYDRAAITIGPLPLPQLPEDQVLLRVHAAGLNPIDLKRSGEEAFPIILGYDVAGVVEAIGKDVSQWKVGDRVFGDVMAASLGPKITGTIAQFCVCAPDLLARVPDNVDMTDAAAVPVVAQTAIEALRMASCRPGYNVFISGGAGGFGIHAIQIARGMFGAGEVATTASAAKQDFVRKYGAGRVVDYRNEDAGEVLKDWADVVIDATKDVDMGMKILKDGGELVSIAEFSRPDVKCFPLTPSKEMIEKVAEMLGDGSLKAAVEKVYRLSEWEAAIQHLAAGRARGKIVIQIAE